MVLPGWLTDGAAKLMQRAPHGPRIPAEVSFTELPATTEEITVPTRHGPLRAIRYSPPSGAAGRGVYLNLHGGGFVIRHPEQDDALCRFIAFHAGVTVINLDYIPAPQSRFPGPVEQAYDVAAWVAAPERPWDGRTGADWLSGVSLQVAHWPRQRRGWPSKREPPRSRCRS
ncbi:alpha/beta hydrolase [Nesterenkonia jeotgali]|uniref:Alpha/beta hydrolase fold-3 domain-containing protein n=1 Tax=Nesterenkonia jeotgali TaxID=317018 RepID=A0A0W8ICQ5_9MICC|nr:alpha/beta hydrolase fold domain-containing protein [Nesterenkonia jeotgali]KUG57688.1 hypothetical protein AVL63_03915 [Nesterenkonia jeotgali]